MRANDATTRAVATVGPVAAGRPASERGRVIKKESADARLEARRIVTDAESRGRDLLQQAEKQALEIKAKAETAGREEGAHRFAAAVLKLRSEQAASDARNVERAIDLARVMAERIIGESLALDPDRIVAIARQAVAGVRRVGRVAIFAHPDDAAVLERDVERLGLEGAAIEIHADLARSRGSLLFRTDLGNLDADLTLQLDRLAAALRDTFAEE